MTAYEYRVVPAPSRGRKARGVKGLDGRFANALETVMNELAAEGWEYQRSDTLPSEERSGLTSTTTTYRNIMVFRRPRGDAVSTFSPRVLETAQVAQVAKLPPPQAPIPEPAAEPAPVRDVRPADDDPFLMADNADEDDGNVRQLPIALLTRARTHPPKAKPDDVAAE